MRKIKIHVLYEYGVNFRPHASSSLRLIRPLTYPTIQDQLEVTFGFDLQDVQADLVLIDRLWRPDIRPELVEQLGSQVRKRGLKLVHWFDDNLLGLQGRISNWEEMAQSFKGILDLCAASVVSSQKLQQEFLSRSNVHYIQSALDERLIIRKSPRGHWKKPIVIGYMGSATHDDDFKMLLPALKAIQARYASGVKFQVIGALSPEKIQKWDSLKGLDLTVLAPLPQECEYQLFLPWFTGNIHWDIAVAPLEDTSFNQYKSDIKFLDYTAAGVPGVYSSVTSYGDTIQDHQTGLLVQNSPEAWINGLEELIESPQLRLTVMDHAEQYLYRNRTLASCAQNWVRTLTEIMG